MAARSLKCSPCLAFLRRSFRGPGGSIAFVQGNVLHWAGDVLATSTSKKLEGVKRADWWGFAGRYSADAALHHYLGRSLREECRQQTGQLNFGDVLVTQPKGSQLQVKHLLHTAIPSYPASEDPAAKPAPNGELLDPQELTLEKARQLLRRSFQELLSKAADLSASSLCLPCLGCGIRGWPADVVAQIALQALAESEAAESRSPALSLVEFRCIDRFVLEAWINRAIALGFQEEH
ncbi:ymdB [Symbiodinium microadriaticum]|nr:ymdB [Symbiodinium sp. KB8]CAE7550570.1 ymdB [Symbiodinium microadriaticum]